MNEVIKEFTRQCTYVNNSKGYYTEFDSERFAELIVQECINITQQCSGKVHPDDLVDQFKHHFGIE